MHSTFGKHPLTRQGSDTNTALARLLCPVCREPLKPKKKPADTGLVDKKKRTRPKIYCSPTCRQDAKQARLWAKKYAPGTTLADATISPPQEADFAPLFGAIFDPLDPVGGGRGWSDAKPVAPATFRNVLKAELSAWRGGEPRVSSGGVPHFVVRGRRP